MMWQSPLPVVSNTAACPIFVMPMKACGALQATNASAAICTPPSVPFLKLIGQQAQAPRVFHRLRVVVDRTRADHGQQARIAAMHDVRHLGAAALDEGL